MTEQMQPGRELDRLVAEILGLAPCDQWQSINLGSAGGAALMKRCSHKDNECYPTLEVGHFAGLVGGCPRYSTDIRVAMEVWTWLEDNYPKTWGQIALMRDSNTNRPCVVRIEWEVQANVSEGDTYPHAISLAVLAAKEAMNK